MIDRSIICSKEVPITCKNCGLVRMESKKQVDGSDEEIVEVSW